MHVTSLPLSFLRTLTTWHCPHSPAAAAERRLCSNRSISPTRRAHSSKPAARCCSGRMGQRDGQTDRQTDRHRTVTQTALRIYYAGSANNTATCTGRQQEVKGTRWRCIPDVPNHGMMGSPASRDYQTEVSHLRRAR